MRATQHKSSNAVLGAPHGASVEECRPLPINRLEYADGTPAVASYWQPDVEQLALLAQGKPVRLIVLGRTHPPLSVGVDGDGGLTHE